MDIKIVRARIPKDARALALLEKKAFPEKEDWATLSYYRQRKMRSFWLLCNNRRIGVTCLVHNATISMDEALLFRHQVGTLYIVSTSILPQFQGVGMGSILKAWQIAHARKHGFKRIATNARESNTASIRLNLKFGFTVVGRIAPCYPNGEAGIIMEKQLTT